MNTTELKPHDELFVEKPNKIGAGSTVRKATEVEISHSEISKSKIVKLRADIKLLQNELDDLTSKCKHTVIYDVEGYPYDLRYCYACDKSMGYL